MKKILLVLAAVFTIVSCHKKSDDPKPDQFTSQINVGGICNKKCTLTVYSKQEFKIDNAANINSVLKVDTGYVCYMISAGLPESNGAGEYCHFTINSEVYLHVVSDSIAEVFIMKGPTILKDTSVASGYKYQFVAN